MQRIYNIQFHNGKPVFIDTLSFEKDNEGSPWVAYRQFCQHFLAPLALMHYKDIRLNQLLRIYIDGIPLELSSKLLPMRTSFIFSLLFHIHLHVGYQKKYSDKGIQQNKKKMSKASKLGLLDNLENSVRKLKWKYRGTEWGDYYDKTNYSVEAINEKRQIVSDFIDSVNPKSVWDIGANTGLFSRIASDKVIPTISFDIDPACVEQNYLKAKNKGELNILPLLMDLTNPSPAIGWKNHERSSFIERGPVDTVLALALIHHMAISNNVPFENIVDFFSGICRFLIIEFIPKEDSQVQKLLSSRKDIFNNYSQRNFEQCFKQKFNIRKTIKIRDTKRTLYCMGKITLLDNN